MGRNVALFASLVLATGTAAAQSPGDEEAREAFQRGRAALQTGDYRSACAAFEESYELEPSGETRFNIALCSEQLGRLATALAHYQDLARVESGARRTRSKQAAEALQKRVPRLRIELGNKDKATPSGFVVTVDDELVTNFKDTPIDLGEHTVRAAASGHKNWEGTAEASWEREVVVVSITLVPGKPGPDLLKQAQKRKKPKKKPKPKPVEETPDETPDEQVVETPAQPVAPAPASGRRTFGIAATIGGSAIVVGGFVVGLLAQSKYNEAKDLCGGSTVCGEDQFAAGQALVDDAQLRGNIATGLIVGGSAVAVAGLVLWLTAPASGEQQRNVTLVPTSNGLGVVGRF